MLIKIRQLLQELTDSGRLRFGHILSAYYQVFLHLDRAKGLKVPQVVIDFSVLSDEFLNLSNYREKILSYKNNRIVPFVFHKGIFGYNTFLYLYFNNIYPVACSIDPYPAHRGGYPGSSGIFAHDITHIIPLEE